MADENISVKLPEEFFTALNDVKDSITERMDKENDSLQPEFYSQNILNAPNNIQRIAPEFDSTDVEDYKKIGAALITGGAKSFFDYWKIIKKEEDYAKKSEKSDKDKIENNVIVNIPEKPNAPSPETMDWLDGLFMILSGAILALGISYGKAPTGQFIETAAYIPKFLQKTFLSEEWRADKIERMFGFVKGVNKPFEAIASWLSKFGKMGEAAGKMVTKIGSVASGSLFKMLTETGTKVLGSVAKFLKGLPFIGALIGFYQSYQRFSEGEYTQGVIELVAAIAGVVPFPGAFAISMGLNLLNMFIDETGSVESGAALTKGIFLAGKAGGSLLKMLPNIALKLFKPLGFIFKRLPLIGSLISFGEAVSDFSNGKWLSGILNICSGIATFVPGIGTAISLGIDLINMFLNSDTGQSIMSSVGDAFSSVGDWLSGLWDWIVDGILGIGETIWGWLKDAWGWLVDTVTAIPAKITGLVMDGLKWVWDNVILGIGKLELEFLGWIGDCLGMAWDWLVSLPGKLWDYTKEGLAWVWDKVTGWFSWGSDDEDVSSQLEEQDTDEFSLTEWFGNIFSMVIDNLLAIPKKIFGWITGGLKWVANKILGIFGFELPSLDLSKVLDILPNIPAWLKGMKDKVLAGLKKLNPLNLAKKGFSWIKGKVLGLFGGDEENEEEKLKKDLDKIGTPNFAKAKEEAEQKVKEYLAKANPITRGLSWLGSKVASLFGSDEDEQPEEIAKTGIPEIKKGNEKVDERIKDTKTTDAAQGELSGQIETVAKNNIKNINDSQRQVQKILSNNDTYLAKMVDVMESLLKVTIDKPVAFADMSNHVNMSTVNGGGNVKSGGDPRLNYKLA